MNIINYYYNEDFGILTTEFSTKEDGDEFYREAKLDIDETQYYSPTIVDDLSNIDEDFVLEVINQYIMENDLPEQLTL